MVTTTTADRRRLFEDFDRAVCFCRAFVGLSAWDAHRLLCWVLMPDHIHAVVELGLQGDLSAVMRDVKSNTARMLRLAEPGLEQVWASGYHDHAVRDDESLVEVARYVVANPVRAGLVSRVGLYPFWNAVWLGPEDRG